MDFKLEMKKYQEQINHELEKYLKKDACPERILNESVEYSLMAGGKRLRPILVLATYKLFKEDTRLCMPFAMAIEMVHNFSLIHDDLPCMDNDDLRRGKPSNHKVFGEAAAVLAGDALISFGAQIIIDKTPCSISKEIVLDIVRDYLICSGAKGIVAGQIADIEAENKQIDLDNLNYIHKYKTGALFKCAIAGAAKIAQTDNKTLEKLSCYADNFGILFQIYDDIIDYTLDTKTLGKTAHKDENVNKLTFVRAWGLDKAKEIFSQKFIQNHAIMDELNIKSEIFDNIYQLMKERTGV